MENALIPMSDIEKMGTAIATSGLFGMKTPSQAIALMLIAQAEGLHPAVAARDYDIIQGRPALKAKAKLGRFQKSGGKIEWIERSDKRCAAKFSHPSCPTEITIDWDEKRATMAGLFTKGGDMYKKYPRQMFSARVISEGVDACYPDAGSNMYVPEEVQDFEPIKPAPIETTADVIDTKPAQTAISEPQRPIEQPQQPKEFISEPQRKRLYAISKSAGIDDESMKTMLSRYGFMSSRDITKDQYQAICNEVESLGTALPSQRQPGQD
jgi:hypothetical protein